MQDIYYIDNNFIKERSDQYILSIRYATDGLSFCIHDTCSKLLAFSFQAFAGEQSDTAPIRTREIMSKEALLDLKYAKVFLLLCNKDKILLPADAFDSRLLSDMYRLCLPTQPDDVLLYRKIGIMESYLVEALPQPFLTFLKGRFPSLSVVNSAYPFILRSLSSIEFNTHHLFIDIHGAYFDLLLTRCNDILLFNSFAYHSVTDIMYYTLNCLQQCEVSEDKLQTRISGNGVNDPTCTDIFRQYIPDILFLDYPPLSQLVKDKNLNSSSFIHLLNLHKCA